MSCRSSFTRSFYSTSNTSSISSSILHHLLFISSFLSYTSHSASLYLYLYFFQGMVNHIWKHKIQYISSFIIYFQFSILFSHSASLYLYLYFFQGIVNHIYKHKIHYISSIIIHFQFSILYFSFWVFIYICLLVLLIILF